MIGGRLLFLALFNNLAVFIALIYIYRYLYNLSEKLSRLKQQTVTGVAFGVFAIISMYAKIPVFEGVIVDQRNAVIALSSAFGGPLAGFISAAFAGAYRYYLGGSGVLAGIVGVNLAASAGSILYFQRKSFTRVSSAVFQSLFTVIIILPGFLFVGDLKTGLNLMLSMGLPYGTAIFIGIFLGGLMLRREESSLKTRQALVISEKKYRVLFESFPLGITITDNEGKIIETNDIAEKILKLPHKEHTSRMLNGNQWNIVDSSGNELESSAYPGVIALRESRKVENSEIGFISSEGAITWLNVTAAPVPLPDHGVAIVYNDVSDRKLFEQHLERALQEKTLLIQELYHRTKNNMQLIIALLGIQNSFFQDAKLQSVLVGTQNRIHSMALVHEKLYESGDLININLAEYIRDLVLLLAGNLELDSSRIKYHFNLEEVNVTLDTAIPCGLLLQEIISNSFVHAFPGKRSGILSVSLNFTPEKLIHLEINDDGVGFPSSVDLNKKNDFGIFTIFNIGEHQLNGTVKVKTDNGVNWSISFPEIRGVDRISVS